MLKDVRDFEVGHAVGSNTQPLVSVAIVTFNQKNFLVECIESILLQDYPNFEIVIADDCSTDGTQDAMRGYAENYPGIFKFEFADKNQGITKNSNAALFACSGVYIAWMGGDDLMLPGKLTKQVAYMESHPECAICYHDLDVFDSATNKTLYLFGEKITPREGEVQVLIKNQSFNGACSSMVRKSKSPIKGFNELIPFASDWLYWIETLHNGGTINYLNEVLGRYRRHGGNVTHASKKVAQNDVDHLNTCNFLMELDSRYFSWAMIAYSMRLLNLRKKVSYLPAVVASLRLSFSFKGFVCLSAYCLSLGYLKL